MNESKNRFLSEEQHLVCWAAVFCALFCINTGIRAQTPLRPFSADQIETSERKTTTRKVYASEKAVRIDGEQDGKKVGPYYAL